MKWEELLGLVGGEPVFSTSLLLSGEQSPGRVRLQLSRWVKAGKVVQLRRGLYTVAPAWRRTTPHPFLLANRMQRGSYVSLQSALAFHGLIPEFTPVTTSVGTGRSEAITTPLGSYLFRHVTGALLYGYIRVEVAPGQFALIAHPEKALLDLVHLTPGSDSKAYIQGLRLDDPGVIDLSRLDRFARQSGKKKLERAARLLASVFEEAERD
jgi:hypothetical protein